MQDETTPYYEAFDPDAPFLDDEELDSAADALDEDDELECDDEDDFEDLEDDEDEDDEDEYDDDSGDDLDPDNPPVSGSPQTLIV